MGNMEVVMEEVKDALEFATEAHSGQLDKSGKPYINHPVRVAARLETKAEKITALLHDVVEDCGVTLDQLTARFGAEVADAVDALSRRSDETYWESIERVVRAGGLARSVKLADLADNMSDERQGFPGAASLMKRYKRTLTMLGE
jgi:(p)ppGpp synthase/HD superfamily hydrolase